MDKHIHIKINHLDIGDRYPVRIMGILNLSPESFYKSSVKSIDELEEQVSLFLNQGADFLDIGGRSTAPTAPAISVSEEKERVLKALDKLFSFNLGNSHISIDTQYSEVAKEAYKVFCHFNQEKRFILNDVSCLCTDKELVSFLGDTGVPLILMASHKLPGDSLGIMETLEDLKRAIKKLEKAGYAVKDKLIIDPAIGHWVPEKKVSYDLELIACLEEFRSLEQPLLAGISRKSFIGQTLGGRDPKERYYGSLSASAIAVFQGAHILRVHEITPEFKDMLKIAKALSQARIPNKQDQ